MDKFRVGTQVIIGGEGFKTCFAGISRVLVITDQFMFESGKVSYVTEALSQLAISPKIFSDVKSDPDIDTVTKGVGIFMEFRPQAVVAFGGGSAMDVAKAIVYFSDRESSGKKCKFIAIPTTSGTGSEVTKFAVISDYGKNMKYPLVDDTLLPDVAVLDATLTMSIPPAITADTGLDVLTHAIEAFVSTEANDFTDAAAEKSIRLVRNFLKRAYQNPADKVARQGMNNASCLAGIAFSNAGLGINHSMAHTLGAHFHIPHGRANAILLPYVMSFNAGCCDTLTPTARRYAHISRILHAESATVRQSAFNTIRVIKQYVKQLNEPSTIEEAGVVLSDFQAAVDTMAEAAMQDSCTATNPRACSKADFIQIFQRAYTGKIGNL